jgi:hypothetical protein
MLGPGDDFIIDLANGRRVYRSTSGLNVLRALADMNDINTSPESVRLGTAILAGLDSPVELPDPAPLDWINTLLPMESEARQLVTMAIHRGLVCHELMQEEEFLHRLERFFSSCAPRNVDENASFLALVYALLALGQMYMGSEVGGDFVRPKSEGSPYFRASLRIVHERGARNDLDIVRALVVHSRYLLTISCFSEAHASITSAASGAMRLGLHLDDSMFRSAFSEQELFERRQVFAAIVMIETSLDFALGLPRSLERADPRQLLALIHDESSDNGKAMIASDPTSSRAETVLAQKLLIIYAKILDHRVEESSRVSWISSSWIVEVENDLEEWQLELPEPNISNDQRALLGQLILRSIFSAAQVLLYSPFLHHLSRDRSNPNFSPTGFEYGSNCVHAAMRTILLEETFHSCGIMYDAYWLHGYALTWAINILLFFIIHSKVRATVEETKAAVLRAMTLLRALGVTNVIAKRMCDCLDPCIDAVFAFPI